MDRPPLIPDGRDHAERIRACTRLPKRPLAFNGQLKYAAPFCERFAFFTPAILYLWGRFDEALLFHFLELQGCRVDLFHTRFTRPLFQGLEAPNGDADWNRVLWAVERPFWKPLEDHLLAAVCTDRREKMVFRYASQDLTVADPLFLDRCLLAPPRVPVMPITAFGVKCNRYTVALEPGDSSFGLPRLAWHPPDRQCQAYAKTIFEKHDESRAAELLRTENP